MKSSNLALYGGPKLIKKKFKKYISIDKKDINAAIKVLKKGTLSDFLGEKNPKFYGGYNVKRFERYLEKYFKVKHAITTNSWTSGLIAAVGAIGTEPGDEIIVTTWTMCASATAILHWNAIPIFADIETETFNIDPTSIEKNITNKTIAILAVDIFGHPANMKMINKIAKKNNLKVITDNAQSIGTYYDKKYSGTHGDIGGFSLNCHKHIQTGEGGIIVTNNANFAERIRLLRNHAEAVVEKKKVKKINNMVGYNFRLGEIEAAIGIEQLKKLKKIVKKKQNDANYLIKKLSKLEGLQTPTISKNYSNNFYTLPMVLDLKKIKFTRKFFCKELRSYGLKGFVEGYTNLHLLPMYQKKIAYGNKGFPWSTFKSKVSYKKGICPIAENLHNESFINFELCKYDLTKSNLDYISKVFIGVWKKLSQ